MMGIKNQKGISLPIIIVAIVTVIAIGGGIFVFIGSNRGDDTTTSSTTGTTNDSKKPAFAPKGTAGVSYVAKLSGTASDTTLAANIEYDGEGNSHYVGTAPESVEMYKIGSEYIICTNATCIATTTTSSPTGSEQSTYSEEDVASWKNSAIYKGKQSCPAGSCDAWQVTQDSYTGTIFVARDGRVSRTIWKSDNSNMTIDLEYKDITITRPENVQTIPGM